MALHAGQETIFDDRFHLIFLVNNFQSWSSWTISMVMHEPCGQRNICFGGWTQETPEVIMSSYRQNDNHNNDIITNNVVVFKIIHVKQ